MSAYEAFSVAVKVSLINQVSAGLLNIARQFKTADAAGVALQRRLDGIKRSLLISGIQIGLGAAIFAAFKPAVEQAKLFQQEVTKFSLYGMGDAANNEAVKFAKSMNIMGSSYVQNMQLINEAQGVFRESGKRGIAEQLQGAKIAAPILARLAFIESGLSEEQRANRHSQDLAMLRFIEARGGANNPAAFSSIADWGYRLMQSSGGIVDWSQLQQLTATSGAAGFNLTQNAISALEPVIADLKGGRTGSGLRVAFQRLLGTQRGLPKQAVAEFLKLGLWDPSKVELSSGGGIKQFLGDPAAVLKDRVKFATDPVSFYVQDFLPAIARKYGPQILGDTAQAKVERAAEIGMVFGPGTANAVFTQIDKLLPAIQRSVAAQQSQKGIDASYAAVGKTLSGKELDFSARWKNLLEQTGEVVLPIAVRALEALMPPLTAISNFAKAHPRLFGFAIDGILALGGALVVSGIVTGLGAIGSILRLIGPLVASEGLLNLAVGLSRFPIIGPAVGDGVLAIGAAIPEVVGAVGLFLAGITAPAWGGIAAIGAAVAAAGVAIYQGWQHWDSSKSVMQNLRSEWSMFVDWAKGLLRDRKTGQAGPLTRAAIGGALGGPQGAAFGLAASALWDVWLRTSLNAALYRWRQDFSKGFAEGFKPALVAWRNFQTQLSGVWTDLKTGFGNLIAWFQARLRFLSGLFPQLAPPKATAPTPKPHPAATKPFHFPSATDIGKAIGGIASFLVTPALRKAAWSLTDVHAVTTAGNLATSTPRYAQRPPAAAPQGPGARPVLRVIQGGAAPRPLPRVASTRPVGLPNTKAFEGVVRAAGAVTGKLTDQGTALRSATQKTNDFAGAEVRFVNALAGAMAALKTALTGLGAPAAPSPHAHLPAHAPTITVHTETKVDGRVIATTVSKHQARALGGVNTGIPRHDPSATLAAAGGGYSR